MRKIFLVVFLLMFVNSLQADDPNGAGFLEIVTAPRPASLGEAYVAVSDDVYGINSNPAGSSLVNSLELGTNYLQLFNKINMNNFSVIYPFMDRFAVGGDFVYMSFSDDRRDIDGNNIGNLSVSNLAFTLNGSVKLTDLWNVGANIKLIREDFDVVNGTTVGFDLGTIYRIPINEEYGVLRIASAVRNIGPNIKLGNSSDNIPLTGAVGVSYKIFNSLLISSEYTYDEASSYNIGAEYNWGNMVFIRMGAKIDSRQANESTFRFGLGFKYEQFGAIDYAYENQENFGALHRISYRYIFGSPKRNITNTRFKKISNKYKYSPSF